MTQDILQRLFSYDVTNGGLYWKEPGPRRTIGRRFGMYQGYIKGNIYGKTYREHRLVWMYHNGDIPEGLEIDHENHIKSDNRIENLRIATHSENQGNRRMSKNNTLGHKGVYKSGKKYYTTLAKHKEYFNTKEEAALHYNKLALDKWGQFAYLNKL